MAMTQAGDGGEGIGHAAVGRASRTIEHHIESVQNRIPYFLFDNFDRDRK
jgi:hypothetical protein